MAGLPASARRTLVALLIAAFTPGGVSDAQSPGEALARTAATQVQPGDHVVLTFLRDRELNSEVTVDDRGNAVFPKIGIIHVTSMTIGQLQDTLRARYSDYLRIPDFQVAVLRRVTVNGEVRMPNVYMVDGASTVRDVIARAGGVLETGNRDKVTIVRDGASISLKGWDRGGDQRFDVRSGDQIVVGRRSWLSLNLLSVISTAVLVTSFVLTNFK